MPFQDRITLGIKLNSPFNLLTKIKQSLDNCTLQTKRLALDILDVQVIATPEKLDIKAIVPLEFITIEQTSA